MSKTSSKQRYIQTKEWLSTLKTTKKTPPKSKYSQKK